MAKRIGRIKRKTTETEITMKLTLEGKGTYDIKTTIPFIDHMLCLFTKHAGFDLHVKARGDTGVDQHHLVEDLGICLGECIYRALGDKRGINRFGNASVPMDESMVQVQVDVSGRPFLVFNIKFSRSLKNTFEYSLLEDFFRAVAFNSKLTVHCNLAYGRDNHHIAEASFKGFGIALSQAVKIPGRIKGIPSTKGRI